MKKYIILLIIFTIYFGSDITSVQAQLLNYLAFISPSMQITNSKFGIGNALTCDLTGMPTRNFAIGIDFHLCKTWFGMQNPKLTLDSINPNSELVSNKATLRIGFGVKNENKDWSYACGGIGFGFWTVGRWYADFYGITDAQIEQYIGWELWGKYSYNKNLGITISILNGKAYNMFRIGIRTLYVLRVDFGMISGGGSNVGTNSSPFGLGTNHVLFINLGIGI